MASLQKLFALLGVPGPVVNLITTGISAITNDPSTASIRFQTDGTVDQDRNGTVTQRGAATDWILPNGAASADYDVRVTNVFGTGYQSEAAAEDTWVDLGTERIWAIEQLVTGANSTTGTFEIRNPSGMTVASSQITMSCSFP